MRIDNNEKRQTNTRTVSRRRMLELTVGGSMFAIAGCLGSNGGSSDGSNKTFIAHMWTRPTDVQYNPWNPSNQSGWLNNYTHDALALFEPLQRKWYKEMAADWSFDLDNNRFDVTIKDSKWHNGDPVTTEDVATYYRINKYLGGSEWDYFDKISLPSKKKIRFHLKGSVNKNLLFDSVLTQEVRVRSKEYGKFLKMFRNAEGDEQAVQDVKSKVLQYVQEKNVGNGVFKLVETNKQWASLEPWKDNPRANKIDYDELRLNFNPSNQKNWQALKAGEQDLAAVAMPKSVRKTLPENIKRFVGIPWFGGGIGFQFNDDVYGQRKVRQAIAYAIDTTPVAKNAGGYWVPSFPSGIAGNSKNVPTKLLGEKYAAKFERYHQNRQKASDLLKDAGFSKKGGSWRRPDGGKMKAPIIVNSGHSDYVKAMQSVVGQLKDFGIQATLVSKGSSTFYGKTLPNGDFRMIEEFWSFSPHPYVNYDNVWNNPERHNKAFHWPYKVTGIPAPFSTDNDDTTIPTRNLVKKLARTSEEKQQTTILRKLAWAYNQDLPFYPLAENYGNYFVNKKGWSLPDQDNPWADDPAWSITHGLIKAESK